MRYRGRAWALCSADAGTRRRLASDLPSLTLAAPAVSRHRKSGKDAGEWLPGVNRCWLAARVVAVKRKYRLTVDAREARALEGVLSRCASTAMMVDDGREATPLPETPGSLRRWDTNGNGRITCHEARAYGIAPVPRGHPALALHARRRRGRRGVRVNERTVAHDRQQGN